MPVAQFNLDTLHSVITQEPLVLAGKAFGDDGVEKVKGILRFLKRCARFVTAHETSDITVFTLIKSNATVDKLRLKEASAFQFGVTALGSIDNLVVEIRQDGSPFVWRTLPAQVMSLLPKSIVYRLLQSVETFSINGASTAIPKVIEDSVSQFLTNYYTDLRKALLAYKDSMARTSKCHLLRQAWAENNRLWFTTKPEFLLRKALHNYLYSYLRHDEIDLREEQNVDDSHPVDIKILWRMENRTAIIEVKWIGQSINLSKRKITSNHTDVRARKGAKQLAEYLEDHRQEAAKENTRGYLVVFDCRRRKLKPTMAEIARDNGMYYHNREIDFNPQYHKSRQDFDEPIRMFLEPVCI